VSSAYKSRTCGAIICSPGVVLTDDKTVAIAADFFPLFRRARVAGPHERTGLYSLACGHTAPTVPAIW
jgi:hypothetical protein